MLDSPPHLATWMFAAVAITGIIIRPWKLPEAIWVDIAALGLLIVGSISWFEAGNAVLKGLDVYFFLLGMMTLAELARQGGLFDWLAALAVKQAKGSASRLFVLVYGVGTVVTIFLSNDATAVVLTPAVYAATKHAKANPLPYLFICAFIANAASFVLPISNPANLVVFGTHLPTLWSWLTQFGLASVVSIVLTFVVLWAAQQSDLAREIAQDIEIRRLSRGGRFAGLGIVLTAIVLLISSSLGWQLGLPTFLAGMFTAVVIALATQLSPWTIAKAISWSVLPLVAGLFVLVEAIEQTHVLKPLTALISASAGSAPSATGFLIGSVVAVLCNVVNNLPVGLIAGTLVGGAHLSPFVAGTLLIGVDLGPNLSVTGSLATILWLVALRREGQAISAWKFLALGCLVMPPALIMALVAFQCLNSS